MAWIGKTDGGPSACQAAPTLSQEVAKLVGQLRPQVDRERRRSTRTPVPFLFELTPVPGEVPEELAAEMVVVGKDICERGIGFFHQRPIPYRRGILTIELPGDGPVHLEVDLLWCRCTSLGWYESGGRLLGVTSGNYLSSRAG